MPKLKPCRICDQEVAAKAKACPHCGIKRPVRSKRLMIFLVVTFALSAVLFVVAAVDDEQHRTAQPTVTAALTRAAEPDELTAAERACADNWPTISYVELRRMKADRSIDGIYDWSGGYWVSYAKIMDIC